MSLVTVETSCRFCGTTVVVRADPDGLALYRDPDNLLKSAVCNRCADYKVGLRGYLDRISSIGRDMLATKRAKELDPVIRKGVADFIGFVCQHHGVTRPEPTLADEIASNPGAAYGMLCRFERWVAGGRGDE